MDRNSSDRDVRELLASLRDMFRDAAARIDDVLGASQGHSRGRDDFGGGDRRPARDFNERRDSRLPRDPGLPRESRFPRESVFPRDFRPEAQAYRGENRGNDPGVRQPLERLREEVRVISNDAPGMDPTLLRLKIEAVTAETRVLQPRISDPEDNDIAAKIMRSLTAIVSEHRPGHVYGLARHPQADWNDVGRRARDELRALGDTPASSAGAAASDDSSG